MEVALIVLFGKEARLAIDAALDDVQRVIGNQDARTAGNFRFSDSQMTLTPLARKLGHTSIAIDEKGLGG